MVRKTPLGQAVKEGKNITVFFSNAQLAEMLEKGLVDADAGTEAIRSLFCEQYGISETAGFGRRKFAINAKEMKELGFTHDEALKILEQHKKE